MRFALLLLAACGPVVQPRAPERNALAVPEAAAAAVSAEASSGALTLHFLPDGGLAAEAHRVAVTCYAVPESEPLIRVKVMVRGFAAAFLRVSVGEPFPVVRLVATSR